MKTIITLPNHSEYEHSIVKLLDGGCLEHSVSIQQELKAIFGDAIWLQEPPSLHITLMEIIADADYGNYSREVLFKQWYKAYSDVLQNILYSYKPLNVLFEEILVSKRAIIIKTKQSEQLNDIRAKILEQVELPLGTRTPPNITHSTLARFLRIINVDEARKAIRHLKINEYQTIHEFSLVADLGPPNFNNVPTTIYPLNPLSES
jgi:2'-5' RNA ligase